MRPNSDIEKQKLPLKLTNDLMRGLMRIQALSKTKIYQQSIIALCHEIDNIRINEKLMIEENEL